MRLITQQFNYGKSSPTTTTKPITGNDILNKHKKNIKLSRTTTGHHIYKVHEKDGTISYAAHNPKTNHIDVWLNGNERNHENGSSTLKIGGLSSREGSSLKAYKLYGHLIRTHDVILQAKEQTIGGMKTWQKLQKEKGVMISQYNHGNIVPLDDPISADTTHVTDKELYGKKSRSNKELMRTYNTNLIAHRR